MANSFDIVTDTAAICIFDPSVLTHRLDDTPDWWCDPMEEIAEMNAGNMMIVGLGRDGRYSILVNSDNDSAENAVEARLKCLSGRVFVGPAEDLIGGGLLPDTRATTGQFVDLPPGAYLVTVAKPSAFAVSIHLKSISGSAQNNLAVQLLLEE